jgi:hypothetical protein
VVCPGSTAASSLWDVYEVENPCYWSTPLSVNTGSKCGNEGATTEWGTLTPTTTHLYTDPVAGGTTYSSSSCHYLCQNRPNCLGYYVTDTNTCILVDNGVCTKTTDASNTYYAISGFKERAFTTTATCTHMSVYEEDAKLVGDCKEHTDEGACEAESNDVAAHNGDCFYVKFDGNTCGGDATNYLYTVDITPGTYNLDNCKLACANLGDDCMEFFYGASACTAYSGHCTNAASATAGTDFIYQKTNCCYWTSPTKVLTDSSCANEADTTINGSSNAHEYTSAANNLNVAYTEYTCQKLCVEFEDC